MELAVPSKRPAATSTRVAAVVIDSVVLLSVGVAVVLPLLALGLDNALFVAFFIATLCAIPYEIGLTAWLGQTIGKRAVKIVVVDATDRIPSRGRSAVRYAVKALPGAGVVVGRVEFVALVVNLYPFALLASIAMNRERRGWHDRVADTWVVEEQGRRSMTEKLAEGLPQVPIIER
ncbi:MAG: hypothetical protein QOD92_1801 [Acidimicrobiaceae bacterium]